MSPFPPSADATDWPQGDFGEAKSSTQDSLDPAVQLVKILRNHRKVTILGKAPITIKNK